MLVLDEVQQLARISLSQEVKRLYLQTGCQTVDDVGCLLCAQCLLKNILCVLKTTGGEVILNHHHLVELTDDLLLLLLVYGMLTGYFQSYFFNFIIGKMPKYLGRILWTQ